jgi:Signal transduction histidine kinase
MDSLRVRLAFSPGTRVAFAIALVAWLGLAGVVALLLWNAREAELQEARLRGAAATALLQAHTASTFRAVDNALFAVAKSLEGERLPRHDARFRETMRARLPAMPYVRALFVIGPDGSIAHDTDYPGTPDVSLADRPYFRQYVAGGGPPSPVSAPIRSRSGAGWFVAMTRKIGEGRHFRGVAVAAIQLKYFSDLYREVGRGEDSQILLFHRDGRLIAQYPGNFGVVGQSYAEYPLFQVQLQQHPWGSYVTEGALVPEASILSYAAVPDVPLVVAQVQRLRGRLDGWKQWAVASAIGLALLLMAMLLGTSKYLRLRLERQRTQERLIQSEKMEALGQLTGGIAHDFANLLGIVGTNIELVRKLSTASDARVGAALERAQRALDNGTGMTRQLMSFSRKRELNPVEVDLNEAVTGVLPLLEHAAGSHCKVDFEPGEALPPCRADRAQLETALINLVVNARHAIDGEGRIVLRTRQLARDAAELPAHRRGLQPYVCLTVIDNGRGMTAEVRRRAVEPFFSTKGEEGTGLGLAQVFGLMSQLGGDLTIDSRRGVGTAIHLCFPALQPESAEPPQTE